MLIVQGFKNVFGQALFCKGQRLRPCTADGPCCVIERQDGLVLVTSILSLEHYQPAVVASFFLPPFCNVVIPKAS